MLNARSVDALAATAAEAEAHGVRVVTVAADLFELARGRRYIAERALDVFGPHRRPRQQRRRQPHAGCSSSATTTGSRASSSTSSPRCGLTAACLPIMLSARWGRIVNIASTYGVEPDPLLRAVLRGQGRAAQLLQEPVRRVFGAGRALQLRASPASPSPRASTNTAVAPPTRSASRRRRGHGEA